MMLPSKLRDLRKKHGLSQKELEEKLNRQLIEIYNLELKEKEDKKQINKYFKKLRNKSLDNLKLGDFPSNLDKESYVLLRKEIES